MENHDRGDGEEEFTAEALSTQRGMGGRRGE